MIYVSSWQEIANVLIAAIKEAVGDVLKRVFL